MLELAMEDRTIFMTDEIHTIMTDSIVAPMLFSDENLGFYDREYLIGIDHREKLGNHVRIVHLYDLYKRQCWHEYQMYIYTYSKLSSLLNKFLENFILNWMMKKIDHHLNVIQDIKFSLKKL